MYRSLTTVGGELGCLWLTLGSGTSPFVSCYSSVPTGDLSGHLLAYLSLSPIFVIVGFVTLIIFKRELHTVSLAPSSVR